MQKVYVYLQHQGFDFYLRDRALTEKELYCENCDAADTLLGVYETEEELAAKLLSLFQKGYDLLPCAEYDAIKNKYCPPELRL